MTSSTLSFSTCPISCLPHRHCRRAQARRAAQTNNFSQRALHLGAAAGFSIAGFEAVGSPGIAVLRRDVCRASTGIFPATFMFCGTKKCILGMGCFIERSADRSEDIHRQPHTLKGFQIIVFREAHTDSLILKLQDRRTECGK